MLAGAAAGRGGFIWNVFLTAVLDAETKVGFAAHQEWLKAAFIPEDQRL